jgi:flagellar protein FlgJ
MRVEVSVTGPSESLCAICIYRHIKRGRFVAIFNIANAIAVVHFPTGGHHVTFVNGMAPSRPNALRIATLGGNQGHAEEVSHSAVPASWITHYRFPTGYVEHDEDYELEQSSIDSAQMSATSTH